MIEKVEEQLVSYEVAKIANEKGFKQIEKHCYDPLCSDINHVYNWWNERSCSTEERMKRLIPAPTQSVLHQWLMTKHNLYLEICIGHDENAIWWNTYICKIKKGYDFDPVNVNDDINGNTYSEAFENGLRYALKLIK